MSCGRTTTTKCQGLDTLVNMMGVVPGLGVEGLNLSWGDHCGKGVSI